MSATECNISSRPLVGSRYALSIFVGELVCIVNFCRGVGMHCPFWVGSMNALSSLGGE